MLYVSRHTVAGAARILTAAALLAVALTLATPAPAPAENDAPLVIGHRGASGLRPEHTLAAYQLAIDHGADVIEPDVVSTADGVLVARHENEIGGTTDVADHPEFADRETTKVIDGVEVSGWFTEDFTLAELKTLRARERLPELRTANTAFDGLYEVPTLQEVIDLAAGAGVGIVPETKHPTYFASIGLPLEEPLVATLDANGLDSADDPVVIQSFEVANLKELATLTGVRLVQLINDTGAPFDFVASGDPRTYADLTTPAGLKEIATYAQQVSPYKGLIIPADADGNLLEPTTLVADAHAAGLEVFTWTFRAENEFLPNDFDQGDPDSAEFARAHGDAVGEIQRYLEQGIDGFFTDFPGYGRIAVDRFVAGQQ